ncbi:putative ABC transporter ATP-binding protein [Actinoplanes missouriensis 431]|uniref:ABC-type quaternary amine transporter n=1 Tax=Actinoplanes missouriensis (strain ATCC 14538 / DSM 43046 / CBS 188.64 / JCM 3121 / NBRC 102363 / NCIMB 12654 / NRRL B-3342 / UNCC 431) TaxID=512565 RepID=I0HBW3_ACTM4|nr:ABC transporter ATP-binding protein [Actinoplanes missouriensis]BAL90500.1 putative ABC transporter ATP-binding protein [Actinoplanes missouriensis 431]
MTGVAVHLDGLRRTFGATHALDNLDLRIEPGELIALLGPSGCGKTTALRILAGLDDADAGRVLVGGKDVTALGANKRGMGMVFQAYSLFPHLDAQRNVEFGLRLRGARDASKRASEMLELVGLGAFAKRFPHQLSGGQQQRVALARALAIEPTVLLLDEPLSALDAKVRVQLRDEIRRIQTEVGTTTLFVTHDQEEALAVADRVGVMRAGKLEQLAPPAEIYRRPATAFVADFVGLSNRLSGTVSGDVVEVLGARLPLVAPHTGGAAVTALVRPETITVTPDASGGATVVGASFLGPTSRVTVASGDQLVIAQVPSGELASLTPGTAVRLDFQPVAVALAS